MIYILKFSIPLGNERHQAQFYLGYAEDVDSRVEEHRKGQGATITRRAVERGAELEVVMVIEGDRKLERKLKNRKSHKRVIASLQKRANQ